MKKMKTITSLLSLAGALLLLSACQDTAPAFDASGAFEAEETIISSEAMGVLLVFEVQEGQQLKPGQNLGYVDSTQLFLKKKQIQAQIQAILSKRPEVSTQLEALQRQLKNAKKEQQRVTNLVTADAATLQQQDQVDTQVEVIQAQIDALNSSLTITSQGISQEAQPLRVQLEQLDDQLRKCQIINPMEGTVLTKFAEPNEMTSPGRPLYKIADLSTLILRVYISGDQLPLVQVNQKVKVYTDNGAGDFAETEGIVSWISPKAEFTPKTIQTKDERANMVYAVKIRVPNEGAFKIGMYGEIKFQ